MVLKMCDHDPVTWLKLWSRETLRDKIDRLGRTSREHDFTATASIDETNNVIPSVLICLGGTMAERMHATVNVCMIMSLISGNRVNYRCRWLGRRCAVQVDDWMAIDLLTECRKVGSIVESLLFRKCGFTHSFRPPVARVSYPALSRRTCGMHLLKGNLTFPRQKRVSGFFLPDPR